MSYGFDNYKEALEEAWKLPDKLMGLEKLCKRYSPREEAVKAVMKNAREDHALWNEDLAKLIRMEPKRDPI